MPLDSTWLTMTLTETSSGITGTYRYKNDLLEADAGHHWIADYRAILAEVAENPKRSLGELVVRLDRQRRAS